jgi:DNA (cytosine-5)-methyltransferase 1
LVFDEVQTDLETEGYEVIPFILPASSINAPHKRERLWIIAYSNSNRLERGMYPKESQESGKLPSSLPSWYYGQEWYDKLPQSAIFSRNDDVSFKLDGITLSKWRLESIKAYGNAIVLGIALQIFKAIEKFNNLPK